MADHRTGRAVITLRCVNDSLLLLSESEGGRRFRVRRRCRWPTGRPFAQSVSQSDSQSVGRFPSPRRATAAISRMSPQLIGLIALLVASGVLALLGLDLRADSRKTKSRSWSGSACGSGEARCRLCLWHVHMRCNASACCSYSARVSSADGVAIEDGRARSAKQPAEQKV